MKARSIALAVAFTAAPAWSAEQLSLDAYLAAVTGSHQGIQASSELSEAASLRSSEGRLLLAPFIFGSATYVNDQRPAISDFSPDKTVTRNFTLGVSKLTTFGLETKLYYNLTGATITYPPSFAAITGGSSQSGYLGSPVLEVTQSLWKNGFGRGTRANQELLQAQALATSFIESYRVKASLAEAENAYWRLALAREAVLVQKESLERAQRIRDWNQRRVNLQLADRADLLQAEAALKLRQLELQGSLDEERAAARAFNTLRSIDGDVVDEAVSRIDSPALWKTTPPDRAPLRADVKAAEQGMRVAENSAKLSLERVSPTVDIFGSLALNGLGRDLGEGVSNSFTVDEPTATVGVRFSAPFDLGATFDTRDGYRRELRAAELNYRRKVFDQDREWHDLTSKFAESKARLELAEAIEQAQRQKLNHEKERQSRGRTTTYQVLLFEQDFASSQLARVRAQGDILRLIAQMKTFQN